MNEILVRQAHYSCYIEESWLLIFDNVESMKTIQPYWPVSSLNGAILVTSQMA